MSKDKIPLVDPPLTGHEIDKADVEENPQLALAALASIDNKGASEEIKQLIQPLVNFQTDCFCKRFCGQNFSKYQCSLLNPAKDKEGTNPDVTKRSCEWGEASYDWIFDYLLNKQRLLKFTNRHGDSLYDYFFQLINSLDFFHAWKSWRFAHTDIPLAINNMGPSAVTVFKGIQQQWKLSIIAKQANLKLSDVELFAEEIIQFCHQSDNYHHLLSSYITTVPKTVPEKATEKEAETTQQTGERNDNEMSAGMNARTNDGDIVVEDLTLLDLNDLWNELSAVEQFVIESLVINKQDDKIILHALETMDIRLTEGVLPEDTTTEMLHRFKTDSLLKLANLI